MKKAILIIAILTIAILAGCSTSKETVKVGWIGPLTTDLAVYGEPQKQATEIAVSEINENGGINNKNLEMIYEDGQCTPKGAAIAMQKLITVDKVQVVMVFCSPEVMGSAPIAEENRVIVFSPFAGNPDITNAGDYIFRNFPSDATSGKKMAEVVNEKGEQKIAILAELNDYAQALKEVFKEHYEGEIVIEQDYETDENDFRTVLAKIKESDADALYFIPLNPMRAGNALKQMVELNLDLTLYSNELVAGEEFLNEYKKEVEGVIYAEPVFDESNSLFQPFKEKYNSRYGSFTGLPPFYYAANYDATYLLAEAIEKNGMDTDKIRDFLYTIKDRQGTAGALTIDSNGDPLYEYQVKQVKNGELVNI